MLQIPFTLFMLFAPLNASDGVPQRTHSVIVDVKPVEQKNPADPLEYEVKITVHPPYKIDHVTETQADGTEQWHADLYIVKDEK